VEIQPGATPLMVIPSPAVFDGDGAHQPSIAALARHTPLSRDC